MIHYYFFDIVCIIDISIIITISETGFKICGSQLATQGAFGVQAAVIIQIQSCVEFECESKIKTLSIGSPFGTQGASGVQQCAVSGTVQQP
jgi:hypothetical protein